MNTRLHVRSFTALLSTVLAMALSVPACASSERLTPSTAPAHSLTLSSADISDPTTTVKLVFVHHSTGQAWLEDGYGGLAAALGASNYFVSDTNYGWGPSGIGDRTDVGDWWTWFRGPNTPTYTAALFANNQKNSAYTRSLADPGGENTVIMFKSCFPNSAVGGSASDAVPAIGANPLKGAGMSGLTVGNAKGIYLDLLEYFRAHPDRLFVLVASPPLRAADTNATQAANARTLANWLVSPTGLLKDYSAGNVFVFDYYTILTGGHHRIVNGLVEHSAGSSDYLAFPTGDSHPSAVGDTIATAEFVPVLNAAVHAWETSGTATLPPTLAPRSATISKPSAGKTKLSRKKSYTWRGTISPPQWGASAVRIEIQRLVGSRWHANARATATLRDGASAWSKKVRVKKAGTYRIRARHADGDHRAAASGWRRFVVK